MCNVKGEFMVDDVLINKAATIERCVRRAREEYAADPASFATNFTRQDAAILNIQRACEAALDMGQHLIRRASPCFYCESVVIDSAWLRGRNCRVSTTFAAALTDWVYAFVQIST